MKIPKRLHIPRNIRKQQPQILIIVVLAHGVNIKRRPMNARVIHRGHVAAVAEGEGIFAGLVAEKVDDAQGSVRGEQVVHVADVGGVGSDGAT